MNCFIADAAYFQVSGSGTSQATQSPSKAAQSLNLGRDDLYVVTEVPQLKCELEVGREKLQCALLLVIASNDISILRV